MMKRDIHIRIRDLWFYYRNRAVFKNVCVDIERNAVTLLSGPSGQGKSTFLTVLNRLWEGVDGARGEGKVEIDFGRGFEDIYGRRYPVHELRRRVGMVFQTPNPLPMSIFRNVAFPLILKGEKDRGLIARKVEACLRSACLWEEVRDRLSENALTLSGGQQQRLCMARALVPEPQVLLLDEPTSSLDEASARIIESLLQELKKSCTILMVTHYKDQAGRIADFRLTLSDGRVREK